MTEERHTVPWGGQDARTRRDAAASNDPAAEFALSITDDPTATHDVTVTWSLAGDRATPVAIEMRSRSGEAITSGDWRAMSVRSVILESSRALAWTRERRSGPTRLSESARVEGRGKRRGRPPRHDVDLQRVADLYAEALAIEGQRRRPRKYVAEALAAEMGDPVLTEDSTVKGWVKRATEAGLITQEQVAINRSRKGGK